MEFRVKIMKEFLSNIARIFPTVNLYKHFHGIPFENFDKNFIRISVKYSILLVPTMHLYEKFHKIPSKNFDTIFVKYSTHLSDRQFV